MKPDFSRWHAHLKIYICTLGTSTAAGGFLVSVGEEGDAAEVEATDAGDAEEGGDDVVECEKEAE
jgi:hypothetical protein